MRSERVVALMCAFTLPACAALLSLDDARYDATALGDANAGDTSSTDGGGADGGGSADGEPPPDVGLPAFDAGPPELVADNVDVGPVAADNATVYWVNTVAGYSALKCPIAGCFGTGPSPAGGPAQAIQYLATANGNGKLYAIAPTQVMSCAGGDCTGVTPYPVTPTNGNTIAVSLLNDRLLFSGGTFLTYCPLPGCASTSSMNLGQAVYNHQLVVGGAHGAWILQDGTASTCDLGTSCASKSTVSGTHDAIATDGANLYLHGTDKSIRACAWSSCGGPLSLLAQDLDATSIATDGTYVYWLGTTAFFDGVIGRVPVGGGAPKPLATNLQNPKWLTITPDHAYLVWATTGPSAGKGTIMRMALR